jgi:hypothetical protein
MNAEPWMNVSRRFTRSVRVDTDFNDPEALKGFVATRSAADTLIAMARHRTETGHAAFTWTGPYGSGKSSLAVALSALLRDDGAAALFARLGADASRPLAGAFSGVSGWTIVPIVGRRAEPEAVIVEAIADAPGWRIPARRRGVAFADWLRDTLAANPDRGLALIIDEMGKFLELAAQENADVHVFQDLAEISSRSNGRLMVVGILHQAFDEYANRLSREARDEWAKIHGRYVDLPVSLAGEEQVLLIAEAIEGDKPTAPGEAALTVAAAIRAGSASDGLAAALAACWPLHPLVASLLGSISRRRFGQSQRSIFGFLTSAEPYGLQAHLRDPAKIGQVYGPDQLWDYLRANLEPAILASPDGHRWSTALDAVERCETRGGGDHLIVLKTLALLDLFKDRSGLSATHEVLASSLADPSALSGILADLIRWSVAVHRRHAGAFALYAGSDFDIDAAVSEARQAGVAVDYGRLAKQAGLQPVLAKRHYEATGALRWFEVDLSPLNQAQDRIRAYKPAAGSAGLFLLLVSGQGESERQAKTLTRAAATVAHDAVVVTGWTRDSFRLRDMALDLAALEQVRAHRAELNGDAVGRREVDAQIARLSADLEDRLSAALDVTDWAMPDGAPQAFTTAGLAGPARLSVMASDLADWRYPDSPRLRNELLNRTRPSSNAAAATRALLRAMVEARGELRLGLEGYPPEAGLFVSLIETAGIYRLEEDRWVFGAPTKADPANLRPAFAMAEKMIRKSSVPVAVSDLYALWKAPPFGIRDGLLPVLAVSFLLCLQDRAAVYLDNVFRPQVDRFFVDRLLQEASAVGFRWVDMSETDVTMVAELASRLSAFGEPVAPTSLDVAKTLVRYVRSLPNWTLRTQTFEPQTLAFRNVAKTSHDPNQFLFQETPPLFSPASRLLDGVELADRIVEAWKTLGDAYPAMLDGLMAHLFGELRVRSPQMDLPALRRRAAAIKSASGNFRLSALATRLETYMGTLEDIEGIASLAANKPSREWVDRDVDAARIELAALAQQFLKTETFNRGAAGGAGRTAFAIYMSDPSFPAPMSPELDLDADERRHADALALKLRALLDAEAQSSTIALGALAQVGLHLSSEHQKSGSAS